MQRRGSFLDVKKEVKLTTYFAPEDTRNTSGLSGASSTHLQSAGHQQGGERCVWLGRIGLAKLRQSRRQICTAEGNSCTG